MLQPTNRTFRDTETGEEFTLYMHSETHEYALIKDEKSKGLNPEECCLGTRINGWYLSAHSGVTIKINNKKIVKIAMGEFYNLKEDEIITHKKYNGFKRFSKV